MNTRSISLAALSLAAVLSMSASAQGAAPGGSPGGPNGISPSEAATEKTPGTPGAADTPGEFQAPNKSLPPKSSDKAVAKLKKQADKTSRKNALAADKHAAETPANSTVTPVK